MFPIIEPRPAKVIVVDAKAERPDQPQLGPHRHARAADAPSVVGNLRLVKDDVQQRFVVGGHGGLGRWSQRLIMGDTIMAAGPH